MCSCKTISETDRFGGDMSYKAEATGFFRVEDIDGRWQFITPDGHPFFSKGVNTVKFDGTATENGKTPFREANEKRYRTPEKWAESQTQRLKQWGFNTLGAWSDWETFREKMPYTVILYVGGSDWLNGTITDCFDPGFRKNVRKELKKSAQPLKNDPWLVGYFIDNEMRWGPDHRGGHIFDDYFAMTKEQTGKKRLIEFLRKRYKSIEQLKKDFQSDARTWEELATATSISHLSDTNALETKRNWAGKVADTFFGITNEELKDVDPNHLNLGARFMGQTVLPQVIEAAGRHVDVMSINYYWFTEETMKTVKHLDPEYLPLDNCLEAHYKACNRPILISEFGFRAADSGLPNTWPPVFPVYKTQIERAEAFAEYAKKAKNSPWITGYHWFEFSDQPAEGRFDGENNNWGLVNKKDDPYEEVISVVRGEK